MPIVMLILASLGMAMPPAAPICKAQWAPDVFDSLDRCIAGDGDGCAGVGKDYEGACDAYASLKWYERGCALGSARACRAVTSSRRTQPE